MDERSILIGCFGLGAFAQAALLLRGDWNWLNLGICIVVGAFGMIPGKHELFYEPSFHVLMSLSIFSFVFALMFFKDILPVVNETVLLWYSALFWYVFFSHSYTGGHWQILVIILLLLPTAATMFVAINGTRVGFAWKLVLYSWFLGIIVFIGFVQFPVSQLNLFYAERQIPWVTPVESVAAGMSFLYLVLNATYIYFLIPIPGRNQSWADRMKDWHEFTDLMTQRFDDGRITLFALVLILLGEGIALILNFSYHWLPDSLLINTFVVLPGVLAFARFSSPQAATSFARDSNVDVSRRSRK